MEAFYLSNLGDDHNDLYLMADVYLLIDVCEN